jgi:predicted methyltransferase
MREVLLRIRFAVRAMLFVAGVVALMACAIDGRRRETASPTPTPVESQQPRPSDTINRPTSEAYKGSLDIFDDPKRDEKLQPNRIMDVLGIKEGSTVADIGAGSGWFTVRAARRVGNRGVVYAEEINSEFIKHIDDRAKREGLQNIRTVLGKEDDPLLPAKSVDAVLLLKTYHEVAQPVRLLRRIREAMKREGLLGIIDRNGKGDDHGIDNETVIKEVESAGFALVEQHDFVKPDNVDYFLVFRIK